MEKTIVMLLKEFFGLKPGETSKEFLDEYRQLSPEERAELARLICEQTGDTIKVQ